MSEILIVDNTTTLLEKLNQLIPGHHTVVPWTDIPNIEDIRADLIVLSGASTLPVPGLSGNEDAFGKEMQLIQSFPGPVVGICFGAELVARAFGGSLAPLSQKRAGPFD